MICHDILKNFSPILYPIALMLYEAYFISIVIFKSWTLKSLSLIKVVVSYLASSTLFGVINPKNISII